ncbi:flagellar brake protein [Sporosarcina siberiensis]|uniref:Flagellar brake protein n=1 Tax=Sporosarcina siberiensis TaxID=1365606 RepID=A0ABW4SFF8_9BACL
MLLAIGTIIIIENSLKEEKEKFKSRVVDLAENHVMIDYPTHIQTGKTAFFVDGTQLVITFTDSTKVSYAYRAEVSGRMMKGIPMLKLSYPGDDRVLKIQRREFVRVDTAIDVAVVKDGNKSRFVAVDISAGGIALNLPSEPPFKENDVLSLYIVLPFVNKDIKYLQIEATVVRVWERSGRNIASLKFGDVTNEDQQRIVRFCFERQLEMRNK